MLKRSSSACHYCCVHDDLPGNEETHEPQVVRPSQVHKDTQTELDDKQAPNDCVCAVASTQRHKVQVVEMWSNERDP